MDAEIIDDNVSSVIPQVPFANRLGSGGKLGVSISATIVIGLLIVSTIWSAAGPEGISKTENEWWKTPVNERHSMELNMTGWRSQLPVEDLYSWTGPEEFYVEVELPVSEQDVGYPGPALMHVSLWMPVVQNGTKVPVIATVHPY